MLRKIKGEDYEQLLQEEVDEREEKERRDKKEACVRKKKGNSDGGKKGGKTTGKAKRREPAVAARIKETCARCRESLPVEQFGERERKTAAKGHRECLACKKKDKQQHRFEALCDGHVLWCNC